MDKAYLKELLKDGKSYKEIGDIVGLHRNTVGYWAKKHEVSYLNINNKYSGTRKFKNSRLFKNIDSQEKAYWLGFLMADGNIGSDDYRIKLALAKKDKNHVQKFKDFIGLENGLYYNDKQRSYTYGFRSEVMRDDLILLGCTPLKTSTLEFPDNTQVPEKYMRHLIRGYMDGDGSYYLTDKSLGIQCIGTQSFLEGVMLRACTELKNTYDVHGNQEVRRFILGAKEDIRYFINYVYEDAEIYLQRKYEESMRILRHLE